MGGNPIRVEAENGEAKLKIGNLVVVLIMVIYLQKNNMSGNHAQAVGFILGLSVAVIIIYLSAGSHL
jgi:hypothetical protein